MAMGPTFTGELDGIAALTTRGAPPNVAAMPTMVLVLRKSLLDLGGNLVRSSTFLGLFICCNLVWGTGP